MENTYGDTNHDHAVTVMGSNTYGYDANGNQTSRNIGGSVYSLTYDQENRLVGVSGAASATFTYDGDGNRVKGTVSGVTTAYIGNYAEWISGNPATLKKYYYAGATRVAMHTGSVIMYLLGDHLGSTAITATSSGVWDSEIRYYPWGAERWSSGISFTNYRFTGQRFESGIGLYFYNARFYDASAGRFIQADTMIPEPQGVQAWDRYAYVNNSPVNYTDPSGHCLPNQCGYTVDSYADSSSASPSLQQALKEKSIEIAEKYKELAKGGATVYWEGLSKSDQTILQAGGWDLGSYNSHVSDRGVSRADALHDPLTYILIIVGGGGTARTVLPWIIPPAVNTSVSQTPNLSAIANDIEEWVGQGEKPISFLNRAGDFIMRNAENTRRFQAHLNNYYPHGYPHFHLDYLNEFGQWITERIFPLGK